MLQLAIANVGFIAPPTANSGVEAKARHYFSLGNTVKQQLGPTNAEDLEAELHPDFEFVAPLVGPLNKQAIIGATTGLDLGAGLPDFDARYHDFRADATDPNRIWCTMRVSGTHTGVLNFAGIALFWWSVSISLLFLLIAFFTYHTIGHLAPAIAVFVVLRIGENLIFNIFACQIFGEGASNSTSMESRSVRQSVLFPAPGSPQSTTRHASLPLAGGAGGFLLAACMYFRCSFDGFFFTSSLGTGEFLSQCLRALPPCPPAISSACISARAVSAQRQVAASAGEGEVQSSRPTKSSIASLAASRTHPAVPVILCHFLPAVLVAEGPCPICRQIPTTP